LGKTAIQNCKVVRILNAQQSVFPYSELGDEYGLSSVTVPISSEGSQTLSFSNKKKKIV